MSKYYCEECQETKDNREVNGHDYSIENGTFICDTCVTEAMEIYAISDDAIDYLIYLGEWQFILNLLHNSYMKGAERLVDKLEERIKERMTK